MTRLVTKFISPRAHSNIFLDQEFLWLYKLFLAYIHAKLAMQIKCNDAIQNQNGRKHVRLRMYTEQILAFD